MLPRNHTEAQVPEITSLRYKITQLNQQIEVLQNCLDSATRKLAAKQAEIEELRSHLYPRSGDAA